MDKMVDWFSIREETAAIPLFEICLCLPHFTLLLAKQGNSGLYAGNTPPPVLVTFLYVTTTAQSPASVICT